MLHLAVNIVDISRGRIYYPFLKVCGCSLGLSSWNFACFWCCIQRCVYHIHWQPCLVGRKCIIYVEMPVCIMSYCSGPGFIGVCMLVVKRVWFHMLGPQLCGPGSSVGVATDYGLDGPGIESQWGRDFLHTSRLALGPTQPPVQWILSLSQG
jgi:hypothetical protein